MSKVIAPGTGVDSCVNRRPEPANEAPCAVPALLLAKEQHGSTAVTFFCVICYDTEKRRHRAAIRESDCAHCCGGEQWPCRRRSLQAPLPGCQWGGATEGKRQLLCWHKLAVRAKCPQRSAHTLRSVRGQRGRRKAWWCRQEQQTAFARQTHQSGGDVRRTGRWRGVISWAKWLHCCSTVIRLAAGSAYKRLRLWPTVFCQRPLVRRWAKLHRGNDRGPRGSIFCNRVQRRRDDPASCRFLQQDWRAGRHSYSRSGRPVPRGATLDLLDHIVSCVGWRLKARVVNSGSDHRTA